MADPASDSCAERMRIASYADLTVATERLLASAQRELSIAHADLSLFGLEQKARVETLAALLRSGPRARVRILVDEPRWLESAAPRLRRLQQDYGHVFVLRQSSESAPVGDGATLIADQASYLRLAPTAYPSGELVLRDPRTALSLREHFEQLWECAAFDLSGRPLGL